MDPTAVLNLLRAERRSFERPDERTEVLPKVTRKSEDGGRHCVLYSELTSSDVDAVISEQIEHYRTIGKAFEWKVFGDDTPHDLLARLRSHGFEIDAREAVVVYDLAIGVDSLALTSECRVERINRDDQLEEFRQVAGEAFGKEYSETTDALRHKLEQGSTDHLGYIGYLDGEPASVGRLYTCEGSAFGGLYGGGTVERFRGRGCYRALVAARAFDALSLGARYLLVDALPTSLPILLSLGFIHLTDTWAATWSPNSETERTP